MPAFNIKSILFHAERWGVKERAIKTHTMTMCLEHKLWNTFTWYLKFPNWKLTYQSLYLVSWSNKSNKPTVVPNVTSLDSVTFVALKRICIYLIYAVKSMQFNQNNYIIYWYSEYIWDEILVTSPYRHRIHGSFL